MGIFVRWATVILSTALFACVNERLPAPAPSSSTSVRPPRPAGDAPSPPLLLPASWTIKEGPALPSAFPSVAQVLADGRLLATGKIDEQGAFAFALLDPALGSWTLANREMWSLGRPTGVVATDATSVLVGESWNGGGPARQGGLRWDARAGTWKETGGLGLSKHNDTVGSTATVLQSGQVLVAGGALGSKHGPAIDDARIWSAERDGFEPTGNLATARLEHTATLLGDGRVLVVGGKTSYGRSRSVRSAELFDPKTGHWSEAGALSVARQGHTATLLPDGRVVVAGGSADGGESAPELEAWDPRTNRWSIVARLQEARSLHTATLLPDGRVIFIGGVTTLDDLLDLGEHLTNGDAVITAETWDPVRDVWAPPLNVPRARFRHVTALLPDGRLVVVGGTAGWLAKTPVPAEIWERAEKEPERALTLRLPGAKLGAPIVLRSDGRVQSLGTSETWDPATGEILGVEKLPILPRSALVAGLGDSILAVGKKKAVRWKDGHWSEVAAPRRSYESTGWWTQRTDSVTATALDGDRVLFIGRTSAEPQAPTADLWNAADESWTEAGRLVHSRSRHQATLLANGVLVSGGEGPPTSGRTIPSPMTAPHGPILRSAERWDPAQRAFRSAGMMTEARADHAAVRLADGRVLVSGGRGEDKTSRTAEVWSPKTLVWTTAAPMKHARLTHAMTLLDDGRVLALGGDADVEGPTAELFDPEKNSWTTIAALPEIWRNPRVLRLRDGRILVATERRSVVLELRR